MEKKKVKRRKFLIDTFQYRLLAIYVIYFALVLFLFVSSMFVPLMLTLDNTSTSWAAQQNAAQVYLLLHTRLWPSVGGLFVLLVIHTVLVSHRIAGPLYRIRCVLRSVGNGCLSMRATFRKHDYLMKERDAINDMIDGLKEKVGRATREGHAASASFLELKRLINGNAPPEIEEHLEKLGLHLYSLTENLDRFQLPLEIDSTEQAAGPKVGEEFSVVP